MAQPDDLFAHGGEMGARLRAMDWSNTVLGPVEQWPASLKTCVRIVLTSRQPMFVWWGDNLINLYNDAYKAIVGGKHPEALGQPASVVWREIWDQVRPRAESAMRDNTGTYDEALLLIMERHGYPEETYYTFSYSPVPNDQGGTGGLICANTDDTQRIIGARQLALLQDLATRTAAARTWEEACAFAAGSLGTNSKDLPFALIYITDPDRRNLTLAGASGIEVGSRAVPETALVASEVWPFARALRETCLVTDLESTFGSLPKGAWPRSPNQAVALPIAPSGATGRGGVLIVGLNPFRLFDDGYEGFLKLVAGQISASVANAQAHAEEKKRAEALAEIDAAKTTFFSNVSHEFRTPLTLMLGPTEDALASPRRALEGEALEGVHRNELRLLKLVNTLLDFSRIEANRVQAVYEPTDVSSLTTDLASTFRSAIERGGVKFDVYCPPLGQAIHVDREMWEKIVLNLLSNAFKFTLEGTIRVALCLSDDKAVLTVSDTGVGIGEDELPRIFERFHRVEGARARSHEGSGIGLALVHDLVTLHGGTIAVESVLGRGTTFTLSIPTGTAHLPSDRVGKRSLASTAARTDAYVTEALRWLPDSSRSSSSRPPPLPKAIDSGLGRVTPTSSIARVLVADDNADMRAYVTRLLEDHWAVTAVPDGLAALEAALESPPDLILSDVMMPGLDGGGLVRGLRADPRTTEIPVILLSARAGEEAAAEGLRNGADDYIVKPFSATTLLVRVESQLAAARVRKEARVTAETERRRLYALFMDGPASICIVRGNDLVIEMANKNIIELWGKTDDVVGKPLLTAVPELAGQGLDELLREVMRTGVPHHGHGALVRLDRDRHGTLEDAYFDFVYAPTRDGQNRIDGALVFAFEVTEQVDARRTAEAARAEAEGARLEAEAANHAKDEFLAMLGHELRNPLAPILTALHLLRLRGAQENERERTVIERQVNHLIRLIDDLLDVSRITRGKIELKKERVEIAEVVAKAIEVARPLFEHRGHNLVVSVPRQGLVVEADAIRLSQVVSNLLTNAAKYTEPGGRITVTGESSDGEVVLRVADNGIGISKETASVVFDLFVQEKQALDRSQGGLGLGLAIVRSLVALHGGSVSVFSAGKGRGSEFTIRLPAVLSAATSSGAGPLSHAVENSPTSRIRILIVDDNEDAAEMLAEALESRGHATLVAHDAPTALQIVGDFAPDVALVDIGLPVMDGYELARQLRARPPLERLRIVAVTGYGQESDRRRSKEAGFDAHLVKPADLEQIEALIQSLSAERRGDKTR